MYIRSGWRQTAAGTTVLVAAAFLSASASVGQARTLAKKQRIAIEERITLGAQSGTFRLIPLTPGPLKADSGTLTYTAQQLPVVIRDGQRTARYKGIDALAGKRGTLRIPNTTASTDAGGGYSAGTGTWSFGRGTGIYTGLSGRGRVSVAATPSGLIVTRYEGYVSVH
jgi:hypothetical protein